MILKNIYKRVLTKVLQIRAEFTLCIVKWAELCVFIKNNPDFYISLRVEKKREFDEFRNKNTLVNLLLKHK
jgi:hypothetical protein